MHVGNFDEHMLPELLALYRARGFAFVTLPQAAADPAYAEVSDIAYKEGDTLTERLAFIRGIARPRQAKPFMNFRIQESFMSIEKAFAASSISDAAAVALMEAAFGGPETLRQRGRIHQRSGRPYESLSTVR